MTDFTLYASDGITPASFDFGMLFAGIRTSWQDFILVNTSGETITGITVEASDFAVQFLDSDGNFSSGTNGFIATQSGQAAGTILNNGTVAFQVAIEPPDNSSGEQTFTLTVEGTKGSTTTTLISNGSYSVAALPAQALTWRISVIQPSYPRLHYDEEGTLDPEGLYIEDPDYPGTFILDPLDGSGNYPDIADILASASIEFA